MDLYPKMKPKQKASDFIHCGLLAHYFVQSNKKWDRLPDDVSDPVEERRLARVAEAERLKKEADEKKQREGAGHCRHKKRRTMMPAVLQRPPHTGADDQYDHQIRYTDKPL